MELRDKLMKNNDEFILFKFEQFFLHMSLYFGVDHTKIYF